MNAARFARRAPRPLAALAGADEDDLDAFLYGRRGPPRAPVQPPAARRPGSPPPPRRERPRREREPRRARRLPRLRLPPDWRTRLRAGGLLCGAASLAVGFVFLLACGARDDRGLCSPGLGGLAALGDPATLGQLLAAAALSTAVGGGLLILLGPQGLRTLLIGSAWLAGIWALYGLYIAGALGDPSPQGAGAELYLSLTNASSTQGWLIALPYRVEELALGGLLMFPSALSPPVAFGVAGVLGRFIGRRSRRRLEF